MYKTVWTKDETYIAKTCHDTKIIKLGLKYRNLSFLVRELVLEHEKAHSIDKCNEMEADLRAVKKVAKKNKLTLLYTTELLTPYRDEYYMEQLKNNLEYGE